MKTLKVLLIAFLVVLVTPVVIFAQDPDPGGITALPDNLQDMFSTLSIFAACVAIIAAYICRGFTIVKTVPKSVTSWIVAIGCGYVGYFFHWGIFEGVAWYYVIIISIPAAIGSNIIYDMPWFRALLETIGASKKKLPAKK